MEECVLDRPIACSALAGAEVGDGLKTVRLLPWGTTESAKGTFVVDHMACEAILGEFNKQGVAVPVDVEHEVLSDVTPKNRMGAVGWIEKVYAEPERGVFGLVRWNAAGRSRIREDAYRYLSPVISIRKKDRRVVTIESAAITTRPAIPRMEILAASRDEQREEILALAGGSAMELVSKLRSALGMDAGTSVEDVLQAALASLASAKADTAVAQSARDILGLPGDAGANEIRLALAVRSGGSESAAELAALKAEQAATEVDEIIRLACKENRLNPHDKAGMNAARELGAENPERLRLILGNLTPYVPSGRIVRADNAPTDRQMSITKAMREYANDPKAKSITSQRAFVDLSLRDAGLSKLSDDETAVYSIAV